MGLHKIILHILFFNLVNSLTIKNSENIYNDSIIDDNKVVSGPDNVFNGVYTECFLHLSYSCLQKKTLLYLKELNNLSEVSVLGDYVKFVKINTTTAPADGEETDSSDELAFMIDKAVDDFFDNHVLKFNALGRDISIPRNNDIIEVAGPTWTRTAQDRNNWQIQREAYTQQWDKKVVDDDDGETLQVEFVGRKKRKGGGGGGGGDSMMGGHFGHDDGGKKKMMMMAMMCMKMKLMMMVPAMMGMMGMMSFKGMMFSMMSFMISKMMLLMKILEKKGGAGGLGGGVGGGDGGWAAGGGGGGAWMPAGGQDFGGTSGGYDANGQWQSRSIAETLDIINKPTVYYKPINSRRKYDKSLYKAFHENENIDQGNIKHFGPVLESPVLSVTPEISFIKPVVRYNDKIEEEVYKKPVLVYKKSNVEFNSNEHDLSNTENESNSNKNDQAFDFHSRLKRSVSYLNGGVYDNNYTKNTINITYNGSKPLINNGKANTTETNSRSKRSLLDLLQNSYAYWMSKILGINNNRRTNFQRYKVINGVRYVYYPFKAQRTKTPKEVQLTSTVKVEDQFKPIITAEDFNKGEIMEGAVEARMNRKKFNKMKDTLNDTMEDNPWE